MLLNFLTVVNLLVFYKQCCTLENMPKMFFNLLNAFTWIILVTGFVKLLIWLPELICVKLCKPFIQDYSVGHVEVWSVTVLKGSKKNYHARCISTVLSDFFFEDFTICQKNLLIDSHFALFSFLLWDTSSLQILFHYR